MSEETKIVESNQNKIKAAGVLKQITRKPHGYLCSGCIHEMLEGWGLNAISQLKIIRLKRDTDVFQSQPSENQCVDVLIQIMYAYCLCQIISRC